MRYLWRAVDHEGETVESYVTETRDKAEALKFIKKVILTQAKKRSTRGPDPDFVRYRNLDACGACPLKPRCTSERFQQIRRWKHDDVLDAMQQRLDRMPKAMTIRRRTVEHPFGTIKSWMGATHFLTKTLKNVKTEMSLNVLAYNLKRMMAIFGVGPLTRVMAA